LVDGICIGDYRQLTNTAILSIPKHGNLSILELIMVVCLQNHFQFHQVIAQVKHCQLVPSIFRANTEHPKRCSIMLNSTSS